MIVSESKEVGVGEQNAMWLDSERPNTMAEFEGKLGEVVECAWSHSWNMSERLKLKWERYVGFIDDTGVGL